MSNIHIFTFLIFKSFIQFIYIYCFKINKFKLQIFVKIVYSRNLSSIRPFLRV